MDVSERLDKLMQKADERNAQCVANQENLIQNVANQLLDLVEKWFDENPDHLVKNVEIKHTVSVDILDSYAKAIGYNFAERTTEAIRDFRCNLSAKLRVDNDCLFVKLVEDKLALTYFFNPSKN